MTAPEGPEWSDLLGRPRHRNAELLHGEIPASPGVYAWFRDDACVYVGKAADLRKRLTTHRSRSSDLSRSTLRASVAVAELGVSRQHARARPSLIGPEQVAVLTAWFQSVEVTWHVCNTSMEASELEGRLLATWRPPLNRR